MYARHMIWLRTIPFWSRWRGWSPWRTALITSRTRTGGGGVWGRRGTGGETLHPPSSVPAGLLVPSVGVVGRHVSAPLGEPDPEFRIWVRLTPFPPLSSASSLVLDCLSLQLVLHNMGKRSRGPPPGTEERKAKRQRRELR